MTAPAARVVVAGFGSEYRHDDGAGPLIAARAAEETGIGHSLGPLADPLDLLGAWDGADLAIVVDAVHSGSAPGTVRIIELSDRTDTGGPDGHAGRTSTHGIGLAGVFRLARAIGHGPARVVVVGIEGQDFARGTGLSPAVDAAVPGAVRQVVDLIKEHRPCA